MSLSSYDLMLLRNAVHDAELQGTRLGFCDAYGKQILELIDGYECCESLEQDLRIANSHIEEFKDELISLECRNASLQEELDDLHGQVIEAEEARSF